MERRYNGKTMSFKYIYVQIAKYGKSIAELAAEFNMDEESFRARIKKGLDPKLYADCIKADERRKKTTKKAAAQEDKNMAKQKQTTHQPKKVRTTRASQKFVANVATDLKALENQQTSVLNRISEQELTVAKVKEILAIRQTALTDTQKVYDEAAKALATAQQEVAEAQKDVENQTIELEKLNQQFDKIEEEISTLKRKSIYLVAPGYVGKLPEFGTFYSTVPFDGIAQLQITEASAEYAIEPQLKDMVVAGYDSYKEYMEGLRFTMLCLEYTLEGEKYTPLVSDEKLQKLLQFHVG